MSSSQAKPFVCELCSMALSAKAHLDNHIAVVHKKVKPHKCENCPYRAANERDMARHIKEVHEKVKPYMCNLCPYRAGRKILLAKHLTKMHHESKLPTRKVRYNKEPNPNSNLGYYKNKPNFDAKEWKPDQLDGRLPNDMRIQAPVQDQTINNLNNNSSKEGINISTNLMPLIMNVNENPVPQFLSKPEKTTNEENLISGGLIGSSHQKENHLTFNLPYLAVTGTSIYLKAEPKNKYVKLEESNQNS